MLARRKHITGIVDEYVICHMRFQFIHIKHTYYLLITQLTFKSSGWICLTHIGFGECHLLRSWYNRPDSTTRLNLCAHNASKMRMGHGWALTNLSFTRYMARTPHTSCVVCRLFPHPISSIYWTLNNMHSAQPHAVIEREDKRRWYKQWA